MEAPQVKAEDEEHNVSCKEMCLGLKNRTGKQWAITFLRAFLIVFFLYFFLFSLDLMGASFKVLGGCTAGALFDGISNPIAGLMVGILATVLVQSSSTSTSIVVSLVGAGGMSVRNAIPVIMGANIGTSVTNTIVSMGQIGNPNQFERAFAGATVHDMFNFLTVLVLLPLESIFHMIEALTNPMTPSEVQDGDAWTGPIKEWVGPLVKQVIVVNKDVTKAVANGETTCEAVYAVSPVKGLIKCDSTYGCPAFYSENASIDADLASGGVCLAISLVLLCLCLYGLVKTLNSIVMSSSAVALRKATDINPYLAIIVGAGITLLVQSSSITTSVLTPLVGLDILRLEQMFPLTLGANLGTTCTALLASLVSTKPAAVQIALCHLWFNVIGILIWFPIPWMRQWPIRAAKAMGRITRRYRAFPAVYILVAFVIIPGILLGVSSLYVMGGAFEVLGIILTVGSILAALGFANWYFRNGGKAAIFTMLSARQERKDLNKRMVGVISCMENRIQSLEGRLSTVEETNGIEVPKDHSQGKDKMPGVGADDESPLMVHKDEDDV